jgi:hypothetical protein
LDPFDASTGASGILRMLGAQSRADAIVRMYRGR